MLRLSLTGAAMVAFAFAWDRESSTTAVSCLDHILRQDATRMQKELVNVLVRSNRGEAWRWQLMSKHFYPEAIYSDEGDKPQMRWRRRSTFTEIASSYDDVNEAKPQRTYNGLPNPHNRSTSHGSEYYRILVVSSKNHCKCVTSVWRKTTEFNPYVSPSPAPKNMMNLVKDTLGKWGKMAADATKKADDLSDDFDLMISYELVVLPVNQLKAVNPSTSRVNTSDKYIQVISVDNHKFCFMGFVTYERAVKSLSGFVH